VIRESRGRLGQSAEIDDSLDARSFCRAAEISRGDKIALLEVSAGTHAVYQVISDAHAIERLSKTRWLKNVARDDLYFVMPWAALQSRWISHQASHAMRILQKPWDQTATDITRRPGNENQETAGIFVTMTEPSRLGVGANGLERWLADLHFSLRSYRSAREWTAKQPAQHAEVEDACGEGNDSNEHHQNSDWA